MKRVLLFLASLGLQALACQFAGNGGPNGPARATPVLILPTPLANAWTTTVLSPTPAEEETASGTPTRAATDESTVTPAPTAETSLTSSTPTPCPVRVEWPERTVQAGDTLFKIAQRANSTVDELVEANCLSNRDFIYVGMILRVPPGMVAAFPTTIPDGENPVIYPADQCFTDPFHGDAGVSIGERWRVSTHLEVLTVYDARTSNTPSGLLQVGENFNVNEGPYCYTKQIGGNQHSFRRWRVTSLDRNLSGWIDEYDVYTDETSIEPNPQVVRFEVSPLVINSGDPITIEWEVEGANEVHIFSYHGLHRFASATITREFSLPPSGSVTVTAPIPLTQIQFSIGFAPEDPNHWAKVQINCVDEFFADPGGLRACPLGPVETVQAAFQPFERGFMVWRPDTSSETIWVFTEGTPGSHVFRDEWEGETVSFDEQPPAGLSQPVRGFGKVWVENDWVRQSLGWATVAEQAYAMEIQQTHTAYNASYHFLTLPDGRVVKAGLFMGYSLSWEYTTRR